MPKYRAQKFRFQSGPNETAIRLKSESKFNIHEFLKKFLPNMYMCLRSNQHWTTGILFYLYAWLGVATVIRMVGYLGSCWWMANGVFLDCQPNPNSPWDGGKQRMIARVPNFRAGKTQFRVIGSAKRGSKFGDGLRPNRMCVNLASSFIKRLDGNFLAWHPKYKFRE